MIRSFRCDDTRAIFLEERTRRFQQIAKAALRKLLQLNRAKSLEDLKSPGNALEALKDDRQGQHAIRINEQYRLCFNWTAGDAENVEIVDYH